LGPQGVGTQGFSNTFGDVGGTEIGFCHQLNINILVLDFIHLNYLTYHWNWAARSVRITCIRLFTVANWNVIGNPAVSINSTRPRTWINAFVAQTAFITRAIRIQQTLGSAGAVRIANIIAWADAINRTIL